MAESIVDGFETIDIHQDQRGVVTVAAAAVELTMQQMLPMAAVVQAGQPIAGADALQLLFFRQPFGGAVGHRAEQRGIKVDHRQAQIDLQRRAVRVEREPSSAPVSAAAAN